MNTDDTTTYVSRMRSVEAQRRLSQAPTRTLSRAASERALALELERDPLAIFAAPSRCARPAAQARRRRFAAVRLLAVPLVLAASCAALTPVLLRVLA